MVRGVGGVFEQTEPLLEPTAYAANERRTLQQNCIRLVEQTFNVGGRGLSTCLCVDLRFAAADTTLACTLRLH
jgi:hypothetical protein